MRKDDVAQQMRETIGQLRKEKPESLEKLGEIMDGFIRRISLSIMAYKAEDTEEWIFRGTGMSPVVDLYAYMKVMRHIYLRLVEQVGDKVDCDALADSLAGLLAEDMKAAVKEKAKDEQPD